jgi:hypothetical protein
MDKETKELILLSLQTLRQTQETAFHAAEMGWRIYAGILKCDLPQFSQGYDKASGISFDDMIRSNKLLLERLDGAIRRLQSD